MRRDDLRRLKQHLGIVRAELHEEGSVALARGEDLIAVLDILDEEPGVDHGGVRAGGAVAAAELAEGELGLVHHGRDVELGAAHAAEELEPSELVRGGGRGRGDGTRCLRGVGAGRPDGGVGRHGARGGGRAREGRSGRGQTSNNATRDSHQTPAGSRVRRGGVCPSARPVGAPSLSRRRRQPVVSIRGPYR